MIDCILKRIFSRDSAQCHSLHVIFFGKELTSVKRVFAPVEVAQSTSTRVRIVNLRHDNWVTDKGDKPARRPWI